MSKPKAVLIIIALLFVVFGGLGIFFFLKLHQNTTVVVTPPPDSPDDFTLNFGDKNPPIPTVGASTTEEGELPGSGDTGQGTTPPQKLRQISTVPTAGAIAIDRPDGTYVRFMERATGHIFETRTDNTSLFKLSNTTIPKVEEAFWSKSGTTLLVRYVNDDLETIATYAAKLKSTATTTPVAKNSELVHTDQELTGVYLPENINDVVISQSGDSIFYLPRSLSKGTGFKSAIDGTNRKQIFSSDLHEWLAAWPKDKVVTLTSKASASALGSLYTMNTDTGALAKLLGGYFGFTTLANSDLTYIAYSQATDNILKLFVFVPKTNASIDLGTAGLPEKCVWSKKSTSILYCAIPKEITPGAYPDIWYQGLVSFNDSIWKIDLGASKTELISDLDKETSFQADAYKLFLNPAEDYLFFTNKKDGTLWSVKL